MRFGVSGDFRKPRARNHEAGGIDAAGFEGVDGGGVDGVRYTEVVGVNDEEFCIARVAEFFLERLGGLLRGGRVHCGTTEQQKKRGAFHVEKTFRKNWIISAKARSLDSGSKRGPSSRMKAC